MERSTLDLKLKVCASTINELKEDYTVMKTVMNGCNGERASGPFSSLCCPGFVIQQFVSVNLVLAVVFSTKRLTRLTT